MSNLGDALVNGTCQLKWLVSITLNSYYLKVQREIEACRLSSQFSWQRKWIKLLHTRVHNPIPTVCYVTFHFYWEPPPPPPAPYSDILRNSPFLYFILLISTQVSREVVYFSSHFHALTFHWPKNIVLLREPLRPKALLGPDYMIRDLIGSFSLRLPIVIGRLK